MKKTISIENILLIGTELAVKWSDETESFIDLKLLRDNCPCAFCSGEKDVLGNVYKGPKKELTETAYEGVNLERIGHYAVRIFWGDRHSDGLYTYNLLRKLSE
tara:strand:+ start:212 stop:520 length:309 start_codon:yes stop_codon:yes gene_type:complete